MRLKRLRRSATYLQRRAHAEQKGKVTAAKIVLLFHEHGHINDLLDACESRRRFEWDQFRASIKDVTV